MKNICTLIILLLIYTQASAQLTINGQKNYGGNSNDALKVIVLTEDGGVLLAGTSSSDSSGTKTENARGYSYSDYWIVKLDKNRVKQWDKTYGGASGDVLTCAQQTTDGGYILGGYSFSGESADKIGYNRGAVDYWVVKTDSLGNMQWNKTIGGNDYDYLYSLYQTKDGGYMLSGYSYTDLSVDKTAPSNGAIDIWLVKLDEAGNITWNRSVGGNQDEYNAPMVPTNDGGFIVGTSTGSKISGDKTQPGRGYWIIKFDSLYNIQWDKVIGSKGGDELMVIQQTSDNGYILGGYSNGGKAQDKTDTSRGDFDFWIVKLDAAHNIEWDKTIGGNGLDYLYALIETSDKGFLLGGYTRSGISGEKSEDNIGPWYYGDYWVVKTDKQGTIEWDKTLGSFTHDWLYDLKEIEKNKYIVGGSGAAPGSVTFGFDDYYMVVLTHKKNNSITSIQQENILLRQQEPITSWQVYPNPAKAIVYIQSPGTHSFSLINSFGKTMLNTVISDKGSINTTTFSPGIYYLRNNNTGEVKKILMER